jgi:hypothetical protein
MVTSFIPVPTLLYSGAVLLGIFQVLVIVAALSLIRKTNRERKQLSKEVSQTLNKMEVMTMRDRNQLARHYDRMLESLSNRLPAVLSNKAGELIFDIEKQILAKLAKVQPGIDADDEEIDNLIRSMERLEDTIIAATGDVVRNTLLESRKGIFTDTLGGLKVDQLSNALKKKQAQPRLLQKS